MKGTARFVPVFCAAIVLSACSTPPTPGVHIEADVANYVRAAVLGFVALLVLSAAAERYRSKSEGQGSSRQ